LLIGTEVETIVMIEVQVEARRTSMTAEISNDEDPAVQPQNLLTDDMKIAIAETKMSDPPEKVLQHKSVGRAKARSPPRLHHFLRIRIRTHPQQWWLQTRRN
jgi:hypothetical protein